jgi:hypothetical protein
MARMHEATARFNGSRGASGFACGFWLELILVLLAVLSKNVVTQRLNHTVESSGGMDVLLFTSQTGFAACLAARFNS